ncbi:MAG TPA: PQQ-dependent sugar dehydrogenase [Opitutaceae bacterium]|nr:PQQ-dependent sugar dehydrogenase [Opitutaceae bacterium]
MPPFPSLTRRAFIVVLLVSAHGLNAQIQRPGRLNEVYAQNCASCHGAKMEGAQAPSMLDDVWVHGGDDESLARSIRTGFPDKGMPPWSALLSEKDIRSMVIFIREQRARAQKEQTTFVKPVESITVKSQLHDYQVNTWVGGLDDPWSLAFLPDGRAVVTEKRGVIHTIENGKLSAPITGVPEVDSRQQAGLYDVVPHPDYARNGWLYLAYSHPQKNADGKAVSLTRIIRGKLRDGALTDQETIFEAPVAVYPSAGGVHFGGRIAFDRAGYLFFTIGERGTMANAQNIAVPMGKVHRVFDDGRIPEDNPFAKDPTAARTIWSYGHRNPQGLAVDPVSGGLFDAEHGPRGGDEVNFVLPGRNYGWPVITYGMDYDGSSITAITAKEGMEQPATYWVPSIAPCGINFYTGSLFPKWKNHLFVASLAAQELRRLEIKGDKVVAQELLFKDLGRIRHVIGGPDGAIYVLLPNRIARMAPAN